MYRDYFETDLEENPEDEAIQARVDEFEIFATGQFDPARYDFVETSMRYEPHETFEDVIESKIFKYKYRLGNCDFDNHLRRTWRQKDRYVERAKKRSIQVDQDLADLL